MHKLSRKEVEAIEDALAAEVNARLIAELTAEELRPARQRRPRVRRIAVLTNAVAPPKETLTL